MMVNLVAIRGDTFALYAHLSVDGTDIDITGYTFFLTIKAHEDDSDENAIIKADVATHPDPTHGKTVILVPAEEVDPLVGDFYYDVQYKDTNGVIRTPIEGIVTFTRDVTRRTV